MSHKDSVHYTWDLPQQTSQQVQDGVHVTCDNLCMCVHVTILKEETNRSSLFVLSMAVIDSTNKHQLYISHSPMCLFGCFVKTTVVQLHPVQGSLCPGESAPCVLTFTATDYPTCYQLDVICQVSAVPVYI